MREANSDGGAGGYEITDGRSSKAEEALHKFLLRRRLHLVRTLSEPKLQIDSTDIVLSRTGVPSSRSHFSNCILGIVGLVVRGIDAEASNVRGPSRQSRRFVVFD